MAVAHELAPAVPRNIRRRAIRIEASDPFDPIAGNPMRWCRLRLRFSRWCVLSRQFPEPLATRSEPHPNRPYAKEFLGLFESLCVCDALSFIEQSCRASACLDLGDRVGSPRERCSQEINNIRFGATKNHPGYNMAESHRCEPNCLSRNLGRCDQIPRSSSVKTARLQRDIVPSTRQPSGREGHMPVTIGRREVIAALGGAAAWPVAARAQQAEQMRRVGVLMPFAENDSDAQTNITAFRQALQMLGWTDSRNVRVDYRWGGGEAEHISTHASELVGLKPDVILVITALALQPLLQETRSIPIVFTQIADPVGSGFVASLAHP